MLEKIDSCKHINLQSKLNHGQQLLNEGLHEQTKYYQIFMLKLLNPVKWGKTFGYCYSYGCK